MEDLNKLPHGRLSVNDPDFRVPGDDLAFLDESPPARPLNAAAVLAEARELIESWDETTPIAVAQVTGRTSQDYCASVEIMII